MWLFNFIQNMEINLEKMSCAIHLNFIIISIIEMIKAIHRVSPSNNYPSYSHWWFPSLSFFSSTSCTHPPLYYYSNQCSYFQKYHNKFAWSITRKLHFQLSVKLLVAIIPPPEPTWGTKPSQAEPYEKRRRRRRRKRALLCAVKEPVKVESIYDIEVWNIWVERVVEEEEEEMSSQIALNPIT